MTDLGRKFWLTVLVIAIFGGLTFVDKMSVDAYKDFVLWAMGLYFTGNVATKFAPVIGMKKHV